MKGKLVHIPAILLSVVAHCLCVGAETALRRPNVLLVMSDDQGYGDLSLHGNPLLKTPNLDRFAREGLRFEQFQVSPFCSPTRASLLTGRYSLRTGVTSVTNNKEVMRHTEVTIAEALRPAGYRTGCFGKWHNGQQFPHNALGQGFDEFFGFNGGHINQYFNSELVRGTKPEQAKGFITDVLTDEAISFMKRHRDQPFFCYVPYNAPHTPTQVPEQYFTEFKGKGLDDALAAIYGMCQNLDENFGRLMAALDELGIRENTLVLFLTDNGANGDRFNAGMRGWKTSVHEGGTRVPLFVQWPRRFKQPRVIQQLAAHLDLYPTLLELCGVTPPVGPAIDGISLVPWMNGKTDTVDRNVFVYSSQSTPARPFPGGVRTDRYRFVCEEASAQVATAKWQLYDLTTDPGEKTDLANQRPAVVAELARAYSTWWSSVQGGYDPPHRIEVGHAIEDPVVLHAPQAARWPGLTFARRLGQPNPRNAGFAQDWLTDWTRPEAMAEWAIEVMAPGRYAVELQCTVAESDAGARIRVSAAGSSTEGTTRAFPGRQIPLPHRDRKEQNPLVDRTWHYQALGTLTLPAGSATLRVESRTMPGQAVMELKSVRLTRER
jgi:arylsulfatase A